MSIRIRKINKNAFSLLEVLLASIIFIVTITGIFATLTNVRVPVATKEGALSAAIFGKQVLETLRSQVSQEAAANYYACVNTNPDGSCADFTLSVSIKTHEISTGTLAGYGLSWPTILQTGVNNNYPNGNPPVLSYTVICSDGLGSGYGAPYYCSSAYIAHEVQLNIQY